MERTAYTRRHYLLLGVIQSNLYEKWDTDFPVVSKVFMKNSVFSHYSRPKSCWLDCSHMKTSCSKWAGFKQKVKQGSSSLPPRLPIPWCSNHWYCSIWWWWWTFRPRTQQFCSSEARGEPAALESKGRTWSHLVKAKGKIPAGFTALCIKIYVWDRVF